MALQPEDGAFAAHLAAVEIVVVSECPGPGVCLERPGPDHVTESDLGSKGPAIEADVHQFCGVVGSQRRYHHQAHSDNRHLLVRGELARRHGRRAVEIDCQSQSRITECRTVCGLRLTLDIATEVGVHIGHDEGDAGGAVKEPECSHVTGKGRVDIRMGIRYGQAGIKREAAVAEIVAEQDNIGTDRRGRIGARFEFLRLRRSRVQPPQQQRAHNNPK